MRKTTLVLPVALLMANALLAGCGDDKSADTPQEAAQDVAMVERMNRAPFRPILPEGITPVDIERYGLDKPGCAFRKGRDKDPLFIAGNVDGFMRVAGDLKRFSAKDVSAELPGGARSTYVGLASWIDVARLPDTGTGGDAMTWPARLILHDAQERVAFQADGTMTCRA